MNVDALPNRSPWPDGPIFLIDDDIQWLKIVQQSLRSLGWRKIRTLSEPLYATQLAAEFKPVAVLLDLVMAEKSGRQILKELREEFPDLPIIIVTGLDGMDEAVACMRDGASDYITKPVKRETLKESLLRNVLKSEEVNDEEEKIDFQELITQVDELPTLKVVPDLLIEEALRRTEGVVKEAAKLLGVSAQAICNRRRRSIEE